MATKSDKAAAERSGDEQHREEQEARDRREAPYQGEVDPDSMVISPHTKPLIESETKTIGAPGDPRAISGLSFDTPLFGTETPYRKTPPTNLGSAAEAAATATPPTAAGIPQANADTEPSPVAAVPPTVAGTTTVGQTLTCTPAPSPWVPAASSYLYQWYRGDSAIPGANAATRVLAAGDVGFKMSCRVTGVHATYGGSSPAFTAQTAAVAP